MWSAPHSLVAIVAQSGAGASGLVPFTPALKIVSPKV
jgi:hypothetical protein